MAGSRPQLERALARLKQVQLEGRDSIFEPLLSFLAALCAFPAGESLLTHHGSYIATSTGDGTDYAAARTLGLEVCKSLTPKGPFLINGYQAHGDPVVELLESVQGKELLSDLQSELDKIKRVMDDHFDMFEPSQGRLCLRKLWKIASDIASHAHNIYSEECRMLLAVHLHGFDCIDGVILGNAIGDSWGLRICDAADLLVEELRAAGTVDHKEATATEEYAQPQSGVRPAYSRDHLWLKWHSEGQGPAVIRDRWNLMPDSERIRLAPGASGKINPKKGGRQIVETALRKARTELSTS